MAASANSVKKTMNLKRDTDGTINMMIRVQKRPNGLAYVDSRPCGDYNAEPILTAQAVAETVMVVLTEFQKEAQR